jgi:hypothetical protein
MSEDDPDLERTPEEKLKALLRRDDLSDRTRAAAEEALRRRQEVNDE